MVLKIIVDKMREERANNGGKPTARTSVDAGASAYIGGLEVGS